MVEIREYVDIHGRNPYARWFDRLEARAAAKVALALTRIAQGNLSNVKGVGRGVSECSIHHGPGYRIYFGEDGGSVVVLLGGGTKSRQQRDIATAQNRWRDYKRRKRQET